MRLAFAATGTLLLLGVAACSPGPMGAANTTATGAPAAGAGTTAPGSSSQMPQSTNSLPAGSAVNAPVNSNIGAVGRTRY